MTVAYRLRLTSPSLKIRVSTQIPAQLVANNGIAVVRANGVYTFGLDYADLAQIFAFNPTQKLVAVYDTLTKTWASVALSDLINNAATNIQVVTAAGDVAVGTNTQLVVMNRLADAAPSNIILPLASTKVGKVKIADFKGNAGTFAHTVKTTAPDVLPGALTQWSINGDGASLTFDPIPGTGYDV